MAWHNGDFVPYDTLSLHVSELAVVAGASVTEMARTFAHTPFRLAEHVARLQASCAELGFPQPWEAAELVSAATQVVQQNVAHLAESDDLGIVLFATAGTNRTYFGEGELPPANVIIHTFRLPLEIWKAAATAGVSLVIPPRRQLPQDSFPVHRKVRNRLHWWLADREAAAIRKGSRALLVDETEHLTETSNACFYGVFARTIVTPTGSVLDSMSRRIVAEAAGDLGYEFVQRPVARTEIERMTAAFVSSTPFGVLPVCAIDDVRLPLTDVVPQLAACWERLTGRNPREQLLSAS